MKILILCITIISLCLLAYHWEDFKEFYAWFKHIDNQSLVYSIHLLGGFLAVWLTVYLLFW